MNDSIARPRVSRRDYFFTGTGWLGRQADTHRGASQSELALEHFPRVIGLARAGCVRLAVEHRTRRVLQDLYESTDKEALPGSG